MCMKNILFLTGIYPGYGGVEKVTTILANYFVRVGHGVSIVCFEQQNRELLDELDNKIGVHKLDYPVHKNKKRLRAIIESNNISILINQWCVPFYVTKLCRDAIRGLNVKLFSVHHNLPSTNFRLKAIEMTIQDDKGILVINKLKWYIVKLLSQLSLRISYHYSDKYIVLSPRFIKVAKSFLWLKDTKKILSLYNPITSPESDFIANKNKEIVYIGRIEYNQKRTYRLLEVWEQIALKYPDWKLTIVGDGPDRKDLEERIISKKLVNVTVEGFQDPIQYYQRASMLLLLSEYEGFPLVIGEAMNYSVIPVILGSFEAIYDILSDGKDGIIINPPYDVKSCVIRLEELLNDNSIRNEMSYAAWQSSKRFSVETIVNDWEALFK